MKMEPDFNHGTICLRLGQRCTSASEVAKDYVYQFKDHLGNVRLTYQDKNNSGFVYHLNEIISENNYYPFGLTHRGYYRTSFYRRLFIKILKFTIVGALVIIK